MSVVQIASVAICVSSVSMVFEAINGDLDSLMVRTIRIAEHCFFGSANMLCLRFVQATLIEPTQDGSCSREALGALIFSDEARSCCEYKNTIEERFN